MQHESRRAFLLASGEQTSTGDDLLITEADLENLIRTKAAIYAACSLVLENVGLTWDAIARVYIAGGFGRYIRIADAIFIGMLPDLPLERFRYIGNSSLTGAYIALLSREHRRRLAEIASRITYVDLSSNPRYMDSYVTGLVPSAHGFGAVSHCCKNIRESKEESIVKNLLNRIKAGEILISDGAMGTFLHAKGLQGGECPESWCASHPKEVKEIAEAYVAAGSDLVETNSFGATSFKLKNYGFADKVHEFNFAAAKLAKEAIGNKGYVAASVGPTGHIVIEEGGDTTAEAALRSFQSAGCCPGRRRRRRHLH